MSIIIAGIHTGIGKTVCSAVLCQALGYDYWKPVQAGELDNTDSMFIQRTVSNPQCRIHAERYRLTMPASPHFAAAEDGLLIQPQDFILPQTNNKILVETAGGIMSPLADKFLNIDLVQQLALPVILVSNNYLGSINHTLLTAEALKSRRMPVLGIVFSGEAVISSREYILQYTGLKELFSIPQFKKIDADTIDHFAASLSVKF